MSNACLGRQVRVDAGGQLAIDGVDVACAGLVSRDADLVTALGQRLDESDLDAPQTGRDFQVIGEPQAVDDGGGRSRGFGVEHE